MQTENSTQKPFGFIYKITNKINGKCYVGQTVNIKKRWAKYKSLKCEKHPKLYPALKKYGVSNFSFDIIDESFSQDHLSKLETKHIVSLNSMDGGYNCNLGGDGGMVGYKQSEETKLKISQNNKGKHFIKFTEEQKQNVSQAVSGKNNIWLGRSHSTSTKIKMSDALKRSWEKRRQGATVNLTPFTSTDNGASSSIPE